VSNSYILVFFIVHFFFLLLILLILICPLKNRLTYQATLAELTSLEELMGVMMERGYVHEDVIYKLWEVYSTSKDIPKQQRRGAIIVLGMLAAPRPNVVADNLDKLVAIGLGPIGKVSTLVCYNVSFGISYQHFFCSMCTIGRSGSCPVFLHRSQSDRG
jgi:hypothetical protein